jgi:hypothetical protein
MNLYEKKYSFLENVNQNDEFINDYQNSNNDDLFQEENEVIMIDNDDDLIIDDILDDECNYDMYDK